MEVVEEAIPVQTLLFMRVPSSAHSTPRLTVAFVAPKKRRLFTKDGSPIYSPAPRSPDNTPERTPTGKGKSLLTLGGSRLTKESVGSSPNSFKIGRHIPLPQIKRPGGNYKSSDEKVKRTRALPLNSLLPPSLS
nr:unnamed protein product [Digitaria exilis]